MQDRCEIAQERLDRIMAICRRSQIGEPPFDAWRFYWVFGNLVQEYVADRVFEAVPERDDWRQASRQAIELCDAWFDTNGDRDWPFAMTWLQDYVKWRVLGAREGRMPEDRRGGGRQEFERQNPAASAQCQWFLGCPANDQLSLDHRQAWSRRGAGSPDNYQWLCRKHNTNWKGNLLFWGDNDIPFQDYSASGEG